MLKPLVFTLLFIAAAPANSASTYDARVLEDNPILYLTLGSLHKTVFEPDLSGHGHRAWRHFAQGPQRTRLPNGDAATVFQGQDYLEVASHPALSVPNSGILSLEAWIRPDVINFSNAESDGYVHWAGKGQAGAHEYALRMYARDNSANRPQRVSAYAFNLSGGLGSGSYFQDAIAAREWVHVAAVINTRALTSEYPTGYVKIFKNGVLRQTTALEQFDVIPGSGPAPLRIGTRDLRSFFQGAIGKFAIYPYEITASRLQAHGKAMRAKARPPIGPILNDFFMER